MLALENLSLVVSGSFERVDPRNTINAALTILRDDLDSSHVAREVQFSHAITRIRCVPGALIQLWENLIRNSLDALRKVKHKRKLFILAHKRDDNIVMTIKDNGKGIPKAVDNLTLGTSLPRIVGGKFRGHGLWISRNIVQQHKGRLVICRVKHGQGTIAKATLPIK
jgi:signal transduction histidine kinase